MPPFTLSTFASKAELNFSPSSLAKRPELAVLVAQAIAEWSQIEIWMAKVLADISGSSTHIAIDMLNAIESFHVRRAVIVAAAHSVLPPSKALLVEAAINVAADSAEIRHKFAHHIWGHSDHERCKGALLLIDPRDHVDYFTKFIDRMGKASKESDDAVAKEWDRLRTLTWVYREKELKEILAQFSRAFGLVHHLHFVVAVDDPISSQQFDWLSSQPEIQTALSHLQSGSASTARRKSRQSGRPRQPK